MLCELFDLPASTFQHRTFTTGATASNVLGLACGREYVIQEAGKRKGVEASVGTDGLLEASRKAGIEKVQIITTVPHSSLGKAASIVGLGRSCIVDVGMSQGRHHFDFALLEEKLRESGDRTASIVVVSCAEVNTGFFATSGDDMKRLRDLCDQYGAWLHVDAAFGLQARILPAEEPTYRAIVDGVKGLELADSITGDAHKLLNVVRLKLSMSFSFQLTRPQALRLRHIPLTPSRPRYTSLSKRRRRIPQHRLLRDSPTTQHRH